jgi:hypothetical protein
LSTNIQESFYKQCFWRLAAGFLLPASGCRLLAAGFWLLAFGYWPCSLLFEIVNEKGKRLMVGLAVICQLQTANWLLAFALLAVIANCKLPICYLLLAFGHTVC